MKLFVYHTPEEIPTNRLPGCAVVIDVLRASSTITAAINAGAEAVQVFSDIEPLLEASESLEADKRIRAGERGGRKVKACEFGNSPLAFTPENTEGRRLFLSTTNGTRCSESVRNASKVVIAALTNRQAVVNYLSEKNPGTVWLVASGWEGSYSLEDTVCAGAIIDGVLANGKTPLSKLAGNDEAIAAVSLFRQWQDQLPELLASASHGQRLLKMRGKADVDYCAQLDVLATLPIQKGLGNFVQRQPGLIEKTCQFLGRLVGRKPAGKAAVPEVVAPAPEMEEEKKVSKTKKQAAPKALKSEETSKRDGTSKGKAKVEKKAAPTPKMEVTPKKGTAQPMAKPKADAQPRSEVKSKAEVKPKTEAKPTTSKTDTSSKASAPQASASKATTPKATTLTSQVEPKGEGGEQSTPTSKVEPKVGEEQPSGQSPSSTETSVAKVEKSKSETTPKASVPKSVQKALEAAQAETEEKGAILNDVKGLWAKMTKPKDGYERVSSKKDK